MRDDDFPLIGQKLDFFGLNCYNKDSEAVKRRLSTQGEISPIPERNSIRKAYTTRCIF